MASKKNGNSRNSHAPKKANSKVPLKAQSKASAANGQPDRNQRTYTIADYRLEHPEFHIEQIHDGEQTRYIVHGDLSAPAPPLRDSKYLNKQQSIEIYRYMLLNRRMETALENLYKQGKVVGGVYFGLGQEACSCASAYALTKDEWLGPMIRNQGSLLVRGFSARDIMMQYMAKAGSPTKGRDASSHFGDIAREERSCADLDAGRPDSRADRCCTGCAAAGTKHRRDDLHRRWWPVDRRHL